MKYCLLLTLLALTTFYAKAQLITDPARTLAARDTLFRQADLLRQYAQKQSPFFTTNAPTRFKRRVVVLGLETQPTGPAHQRYSWRQITRYRRNGRVQQRFFVQVGNTILLEERRLNDQIIWLSLPKVVASSAGRMPHHVGTYYESGYVTLDRTSYVLPRTTP